VALKNTAKANNYEFMGGAETYTGATTDISAATQTITAANQTLTVTHTLDLSTIASSNAGTDATLTYSIMVEPPIMRLCPDPS
jgi:cellobiose-specific phosphotransferase system component IIA